MVARNINNLKSLVRTANDLDEKGLYKEADLIDQRILKMYGIMKQAWSTPLAPDPEPVWEPKLSLDADSEEEFQIFERSRGSGYDPYIVEDAEVTYQDRFGEPSKPTKPTKDAAGNVSWRGYGGYAYTVPEDQSYVKVRNPRSGRVSRFMKDTEIYDKIIDEGEYLVGGGDLWDNLFPPQPFDQLELIPHIPPSDTRQRSISYAPGFAPEIPGARRRQ